MLEGKERVWNITAGTPDVRYGQPGPLPSGDAAGRCPPAAVRLVQEEAVLFLLDVVLHRPLLLVGLEYPFRRHGLREVGDDILVAEDELPRLPCRAEADPAFPPPTSSLLGDGMVMDLPLLPEMSVPEADELLRQSHQVRVRLQADHIAAPGILARPWRYTHSPGAVPP